MAGLFDKVRKLLRSKIEPEPVKPQIPQDWLNEAQKAVGSLYSKEDLRAARAAEAQSTAAESTVDTTELRQNMLNNLSVDDIAAIATEMGFVNLDGGKGRQVMTLLMLSESNNRLDELAALCRQQAPSANW